MAQLALNSSGNLSASGIFSVIEPTSYINSEATSYTSTVTYTACPSINLASSTTIDGVGLRIFRQLLTTGTFSVALALAATPTVPIASVTVNVSDLSAFVNTSVSGGGWAFFKFASPQTLTSGTNYVISIRSSIASTVSVYRLATGTNNFCKYLRTTTTAAPASSGDNIIICGDLTGAGTGNSYTLTNNNTSSNSFNSLEVGARGSLTWANSASTAYQLNINGTPIIGTLSMIFGPGSAFSSPGSFNSTSTHTTTITATGLGTNGVTFRNGSTVNLVGATKTPFATLTADVAAGAITSITTDVSTGWSSGDILGFAPTQRVIAQYEAFPMTGNASGTSVPIAATLAFSHSGTAPFAAKIVNNTRNIKFTGTSQSLSCYFVSFADNANFQYVEFANFGINAVGRRGFEVYNSVGTTFDGCSFHDLGLSSGSVAISTLVTTTHNNVIVTNCGFYIGNAFGSAVSSTTTSLTTGILVNNCVSIGGGGGFNTGTDSKSTFTNLWVYGVGTGITLSAGPASITAPWAQNNLYANSCTTGFSIGLSGISPLSTNVFNLSSYRNVNYGYNVGNLFEMTGTNWIAIGNGTAGQIWTGIKQNIYFPSHNFQGATSFVQPNGILLSNAVVRRSWLLNSTLGTTVAHTGADINGNSTLCDTDMTLINCTLGSTTKITGIQNFSIKSRIGQQNSGNTLNNNFTTRSVGVLTYDTTIVDSSPVSLRMAPSNTVYKLQSNMYTVGVPSGNIATITVKVRKSTAGDGVAYNGNQPRLLLLQNLAGGSTYITDIICATASGPAGTWETLTYVLPTSVSASTGFEFAVDCDGTAGWVNVDTWTVA